MWMQHHLTTSSSWSGYRAIDYRIIYDRAKRFSDMAGRGYEPMPRIHHNSAQVDSRVLVCSGRTEDYSQENQKRLQSIVEFYDPHTERWEDKRCTGEAPVPGLTRAASASSTDVLFTYGGWNGVKIVNSLHQLNAKTYRWSELCSKNAESEFPMAKLGAKMVVCDDMLALLGGYCRARTPLQRGSSFIETERSDGSGCTNEFHIYRLSEGM